jgi:hypothetical protein
VAVMAALKIKRTFLDMGRTPTAILPAAAGDRGIG